MGTKVIVIDRYEGETEDILKKIAEAGEEPIKIKATSSLRDFKSELNTEIFKSITKMCLSNVIKPENIDKILEMGFATAPASTKYHGNYKGGLLEHSKEVATALLNLTVDLHLEWQRKESPIIVGLFHDLCKVDQYILQEDGSYEFNKECPQGHGTKSVEYIEKYLECKLTDEEKACIEHHMGAFTDKEGQTGYTEAIKKYPNVLFTHTADMIASHIKNI